MLHEVRCFLKVNYARNVLNLHLGCVRVQVAPLRQQITSSLLKYFILLLNKSNEKRKTVKKFWILKTRAKLRLENLLTPAGPGRLLITADPGCGHRMPTSNHGGIVWGGRRTVWRLADHGVGCHCHSLPGRSQQGSTPSATTQHCTQVPTELHPARWQPPSTGPKMHRLPQPPNPR